MLPTVTPCGLWFSGSSPGFSVDGLFVWSWGTGAGSVVEGPGVGSVRSSRGRWSLREASISLRTNYPSFYG